MKKLFLKIAIILNTFLSSFKNVDALSHSQKSTIESDMYLLSEKYDDLFVFSGVVTILCVLLLLIVLIAFIKIKKMNKKIHFNKVTDLETGIGNLAFFEHNFKNTIPAMQRNMYYLAYIIVDSNFLQFDRNDAIFMDAAKYIASTLMSSSDEGEFAARITESGFVFAFKSNDFEKAEKRIEEIVSKMNVSLKPEDKDAKPVLYTAFYNLHNDDHNCELLLFNLRRNCSKIIGTDEQLVYCDIQAMNSAIEEKRLTESIINGLKNKEFKLHLQFIVDSNTKKIASAEALSRWDHKERGRMLPITYIGLMESMGMISELDFYMLDAVCRQLHKWNDTELGDITISCNFTRVTLSEENFIERLIEITNKYVFDKSKLIIEITEDTIEKNVKTSLNNVSKAKKMGFQIALDDLGSGCTSLKNLCDYPIDIVKIDRDILLKIEKENGKKLFMGMVALAHSLNKKVICEGVETEEQKEFVISCGCDYIQGWYYTRELPVKECEKFYFEYSGKLS